MQDYLFLKDSKDYKKILVSEIIYIEAAKNYCKIVTTRRDFLILVALKEVEELLNPYKRFCRIHRSFLISLDKIEKFDTYVVCMTMPNTSVTLPIGEQYRNCLLETGLVIIAPHRVVEPEILAPQLPVESI